MVIFDSLFVKFEMSKATKPIPRQSISYDSNISMRVKKDFPEQLVLFLILDKVIKTFRRK